MRIASKLVVALLFCVFSAGCSDDGSGEGDSDTSSADADTDTDADADTTSGDQLPAGYAAFYNLIEDPYIDGDVVVIHTADVPDHGSPFFDESDDRWEAYNGDNENFSTEILGMDPDLAEQDITLRLPLAPAEDPSHQATTGGPIGVTVNGIVIYNQYNGMGALLDDVEFNNLDQYNGHPTPMNAQYHHHLEPVWLTAANGTDSLVGFLLDGFPLYGPTEDGVTLTSSDLDAYHGHTGPTAEYPDGIYHYHCTADAPWINGDGYWGTPGTVTN